MQKLIREGDTSRRESPIFRGRLQVRGFDEIWLRWSKRGLVGVEWVRTETGVSVKQPSDRDLAEVRDVPELYADLLQQYFDGKSVDPAELPVDLHGTAFQVAVWKALRSIPRGRVRSYAGIAADVGSPRAARAVGAANKANPLPIVVPCHRVVETGLRLGGYSGGLDRKRYLLKLEGVNIDADLVHPGQLDLL